MMVGCNTVMVNSEYLRKFMPGYTCASCSYASQSLALFTLNPDAADHDWVQIASEAVVP